MGIPIIVFEGHFWGDAPLGYSPIGAGDLGYMYKEEMIPPHTWLESLDKASHVHARQLYCPFATVSATYEK